MANRFPGGIIPENFGPLVLIRKVTAVSTSVPYLKDFTIRGYDMTYTIKFLPQNSTIEVKENESLIRAAMEAGVHINASCGGTGVCGKCRVRIEEGEVAGGVSEHLSPEF